MCEMIYLVPPDLYQEERNFMRVLLSIVHIVVAVFMVGVVLLQQRKQGGFSGVFGWGTQADSGQWQRFTPLTKITIVLAAVFMVTSFLLVFLS